MIIAGEASGDLHGAKVAAALRHKRPDVCLFGIGGDALQAAGMRILADAASLAVVGITEIIAKLPSLLKGLRKAKQALRELRPDLLILIDFPDFNLMVAKAAKRARIPVLYYISPQIWAWRTGRVKKIASLVNHMAVILPFEEKFYKDHKVPVTFVGHPLLDAPLPSFPLSRPADDPSPLTIGLLPGSRDREVSRLLPVMLAAAILIENQGRKVRFILSHARTVQKHLIQDILQRQTRPVSLEIHKGPVDRIFKVCDLIVAASGTVTLEAAIAGVPMIIIYKISSLSYWLGSPFIRVSHIGLINLINDESLVTELIQADATAANIAAAVGELVCDPAGLQAMREQLFHIRTKLGGPGASARVADLALSLVSTTQS